MQDISLNENITGNKITLNQPLLIDFNGRKIFLNIIQAIFFQNYILISGFSSAKLEFKVLKNENWHETFYVEYNNEIINQKFNDSNFKCNNFVILTSNGSKQSEILLKTCLEKSECSFLCPVNSQNIIYEYRHFLWPGLLYILEKMEFLSEEWHKLVKYLPPLMLKDNQAFDWLDENHAYVYKLAALYLKDFNTEEWAAQIDGIVKDFVAGWVKKINQIQNQEVYIKVFGGRKSPVFKADELRYDLLALNIGNGAYGFKYKLSNIISGINNYYGIGLYSAEDNELISFKFIDYKKIPHKYSLSWEVITREKMSGWCVDQYYPEMIFNLNFYLDDQYYISTDTSGNREDLKNKGISKGKGGFKFPLPLYLLPVGKHYLKCGFPDGSFSDEYCIEGSLNPIEPLKDISILQKRISIIIPVHNAAQDLEICLARLLKYTPDIIRIIIVDDYSTDPEIEKIYRKYENDARFEILKNDKNLGFSGSVNRGIQAAGGDDIVLLNSDARVTPKWLESMLIASISEPGIATVTPLSDNAGIFSFPEIEGGNPLPPYVEEEQFARAFRRNSLGLYPEVPSGNGFCMFINRQCLNEIGLFDAKAFPRGYGEENDFCMRACRAGWKNIIDDRAYIFHAGSKSFCGERESLTIAGRKILNSRYPEYTPAISHFFYSAKMIVIRNRARITQNDVHLLQQAKKLRMLIVTSTKTGGIPQAALDIYNSLKDVFDIFFFRCDGNKLELNRYIDGEYINIFNYTLSDRINPLSHISYEYDSVIASWLFVMDIDIVHIHHLGWHSLNLPEIAKKTGCKVVFTFHDFYMANQTVKMLDDAGVFLGNDYLEQGSIYRENIWQDCKLPIPEKNWLEFWQQRSAKTLSFCDALTTVSEKTKIQLQKLMPGFRERQIFVIPNGRDFNQYYSIGHLPAYNSPLKLLVPGNMNAAKGLYYILSLAEYDKEKLIQFHICGNIYDENIKSAKLPDNIIAHGEYDQKNFPEIVEKINPHAAVIFSIWDETYCYTLTECWALGLPVFVLNMPQLAERIKQNNAGWIISSIDIPECYNEIIKNAYNSKTFQKALNSVRKWQDTFGAAENINMMGISYLKVYKSILNSKTNILKNKSIITAVVVDQQTDNWDKNIALYNRIFSWTKNSVERDIIYVPMTLAAMLTNIKKGWINFVILDEKLLPPYLIPEFLNLAKKFKVSYILDFERKIDEQNNNSNYILRKNLVEKAKFCIALNSGFLPSFVSEKQIKMNMLSYKLPSIEWIHKCPKKDKNDKFYMVCVCLTDGDKEAIKELLPVLDVFYTYGQNFSMIIYGSEATTASFAYKKQWLEVKAISDSEFSYSALVNKIREKEFINGVALAPLTKDKIPCFHILDYCAIGLPVIASEEWKNIDNKINFPEIAYVPASQIEWARALKNSIGEKDKKRGLSLRMRALEYILTNKDLNLMDKTIKETL